MDFRRIEMIFLVVFIALDIFLFASYHQAQSVVVNSSSSATSVSSEMKSSDISTGKLSTKKQRGYYLSGKADESIGEKTDNLNNKRAVFVRDNAVTVALKNPLNLKGKDPATVLNKFVKGENNILHGDSYKYMSKLTTDNSYVFYQATNYGQIYDTDAKIIFNRQGDKIVSYQQTYTNNISILREEQDTISEQDAVNNLYIASEIPDNSKILWTNLSYGRLLTAKGSAIYIPVWHVEVMNKNIGNKTLKLVNGFSGNTMKNQQKEDVN